MATINHKTYNEGTETFKDFSVYDGKDTLIFKVDGSDGNVGIGTTTPNKKLTIYGGNDNGIWVDSGGAQYTTIALGNAGSEKANIAWDNTNGGLLFTAYGSSFQSFSTNSSERVRITSAGNVGIGTSSPSALLHISQAGANTTLRVGNNSAYDQFLYFNGDTDWSIGIDYSNSNAFVLSNASSLGANDAIVVKTGGNVGIGTTSPNAKATIWTASATGQQTALRVNNPYGFGDQNTGAKIVFSQDRSTSENIPMGEIGVGQSTAGSSDNAYFKISVANGGTVSEVARFISGGGLTFNGDTSQANALDDYEEGTFTPTFSGATITGGNLRGSYTKIGRMVYVTVQFINATISGAGGNAQINSLPFTCNSLYFGVASLTYADGLSANATGWVDTAGTTIYLMDGTGTSNVSFVDGSNNRSIMLNAVYQVA